MMTISKRRLKKQLRALLILAVLAGAAYGLGWSNYFHVSSIQVRGTNQSALLLQDIRNNHVILHVSMPMARVDVKAMNASLIREQWLSEIHISRNWLSGRVTINVRERKPVAQYLDPSGITHYFDGSGFAFTSPQGYGSLPTVSLAMTNDNQVSLRTGAATFIAQMPQDILGSMQSLTVTGGDAKLMSISMVSGLVGKPLSIQWGNASDLPLKIKVLRALVERPENAKVTSIDLSIPTSPVTK